MLTPTSIYAKQILALIQEYPINGIAHITGGGITDNLPRCLPDGLDAQVDLDAIAVLPVFKWLAKQAGVHDTRVAQCDFGKHSCQMIDPTQIHCGGFIAPAFRHDCPTDFECNFAGHVPDVGGTCVASTK